MECAFAYVKGDAGESMCCRRQALRTERIPDYMSRQAAAQGSNVLLYKSPPERGVHEIARCPIYAGSCRESRRMMMSG
jgi:hypothetical protein